jgi:hypothetical protein
VEIVREGRKWYEITYLCELKMMTEHIDGYQVICPSLQINRTEESSGIAHGVAKVTFLPPHLGTRQ